MKYGSKLFLAIIEIIILLFLVTIPYYFDLIGDKTYSFIKLILVLGSIFWNAYLLGKDTSQKGYLEGIKYGSILIIIFFLIHLLLGNLHVKVLLYYVLILTSSTLGSMIGISRKKKR